MLKLPVITKCVTLAEIPGEVAVFFEIGNCKLRCKGCHSEWLRTRLAEVHWTDIEEMLQYVIIEKARGATAIVLMGGTTNGIPLPDLEEAIRRLAKLLPVGIYSGAAVNSTITKFLKEIPSLTWIKAGEYREELGGLNSVNTNQRFYARTENGWEDSTSVFNRD